jgi:glucan phosphorylase
LRQSLRDILSQRWVHPGDTYERENPKRVYSLSTGFLVACLLADLVRRFRRSNARKFSGDHTIAQYAADIRNAKPCPVS